MFYCEMRLDGFVKIYELSDTLLLMKSGVEARSSCFPVPSEIGEAIEYLRSICWELHIFEALEDLEDWAAEYTGFRSGEIRVQLAEYQLRRASYETLKPLAA